MTDLMVEKKVQYEEDEIKWFCGCEIVRDGNYSNHEWDSEEHHPNHKSRFNPKTMQMEYVCHENEVFRTVQYKRYKEKND